MIAKILTLCLAVVLVAAELSDDEPSSSRVSTSDMDTGNFRTGMARQALIPYREFLTVRCTKGYSVAVHGAWYVMLSDDELEAMETDTCKHSDIPDKNHLCPTSQQNEPGLCRLYSRDPSTNAKCRRRGVQIVYNCHNAMLRS
ncbi:uncharacterized protein LOC129583356 isoform X2 [Paramacrobiotus metropolitanus]|uniref:uncharacterized protein LOC129583356 isoform X2 n=1 Tax=Paramacrobiotus metropolitanus TaxID=2943436 RepID=UPI002445D838|nr:uncharacterized protein LOC129583356 isoform X2 [Paramacrobiotus metropolitanus]